MVDVGRPTYRTKGEPPTNRRIELKSMLNHEASSEEYICYRGKQLDLLFEVPTYKSRTRSRATILTTRDQSTV